MSPGDLHEASTLRATALDFNSRDSQTWLHIRIRWDVFGNYPCLNFLPGASVLMYLGGSGLSYSVNCYCPGLILHRRKMRGEEVKQRGQAFNSKSWYSNPGGIPKSLLLLLPYKLNLMVN